MYIWFYQLKPIYYDRTGRYYWGMFQYSIDRGWIEVHIFMLLAINICTYEFDFLFTHWFLFLFEIKLRYTLTWFC
jgi:hypothetical protein